MVLIEIFLVIVGGLLIAGLGELAARLRLGRHWTGLGCGLYFVVIVWIVPAIRFSTPAWNDHPYSLVHMSNVYMSEEACGWSFFWLVAAVLGVWLLQAFKAPDDKPKGKPKRKRKPKRDDYHSD